MDIIDVPVVVGAGHAGLCVVAELNVRGVRPWLVTADAPGATWEARYEALRLNTQAQRSAVPHHPTPDELGRWPSASQWACYLRDVALRLDAQQRRGTVRRIRREASHWLVETETGAIASRHVVVATGRHRVPAFPAWAEQSEGAGPAIHHASEFRRPERFAGQRVLVVGAGNSGSEIAHLLVGHAATVAISVRSKPMFVKREIAGVGLTTAGAMARHLPHRLVSVGARALQRLTFGDLAPHDLGPPDHDLADPGHGSGPTVDSGFVDDVKLAKIDVVSAVTGIVDGRVRFRHDHDRSFDTVICATGYRTGLAELIAPRYLTPDGEWPRPAVESDGLHFAGFEPASLTSFMPDFASQAAGIADRITAPPEGSGHDTS